MSEGLDLKVWRLHPNGCTITAAEKTLNGAADKAAVRWCGPFTNANRAGWWVFPPVDIDIVWKGGKDFEWELHTPYTNADEVLIRFLLEEEEADVDRWLLPGGRSKFTWGLLGEGVMQMWTGCIFQTSPGWGLYLRSPVNVPRQPCYVMEAILETDWLQYDIWLNIVFDREGEVARFRRNEWPPVAQILPVPRETHDARWEVAHESVNRNSPDANRVFEYFVQYNRKKFASGGKNWRSPDGPELGFKDSATYYKERKRSSVTQTAPARDRPS